MFCTLRLHTKTPASCKVWESSFRIEDFQDFQDVKHLKLKLSSHRQHDHVRFHTLAAGHCVHMCRCDQAHYIPQIKFLFFSFERDGK